MISAGANVNTKKRSDDGTALIMAAIWNNNPQITKTLIENGADVQAKDNKNKTALDYAKEQKKEEVIAILKQAKEENIPNLNQSLAIPNSVSHSDSAISIEQNNVNNLVDADWWKTATFEDVRREIDKGADVNAKNDNEETPLHLAAYQNNPKIIELLVENGADINAKGCFSEMTPLMIAAQNSDNSTIIETMIKLGASVNEKNMGDISVVDYAAYKNKNPAILETLLKYGGNINDETLSWAQENENPDIKVIVRKHLQYNPNETKTELGVHNNSEDDEVIWNDGTPQNINQAYENANYTDKISFAETFEECITQQKLNQAYMDSLPIDMRFQMAFSGGSNVSRQCKCIFQAARKYLGDEEYNKAQNLRKQGRDGSADKILKQALPAAFGECF